MPITAQNLRKLIKLKFDYLQECANAMEIDKSTLSRNIKNPSPKFLRRLAAVGVPVPDEYINRDGFISISKNGVEDLNVREPGAEYSKQNYKILVKLLRDENQKLKAEVYDLQNEIKRLKGMVREPSNS